MCKYFAWSCVELDVYRLDAKRNSCNNELLLLLLPTTKCVLQ